MRPIRSLLWIGPGEGLVRAGLCEAPGLDITWVPDVEAALDLPPVQFDATVFEGLPPAAMATGLRRLRPRAGGAPALVVLSEANAAEASELEAAGATRLVLTSRGDAEAGLLDRLHGAIEDCLERGETPRVADRGDPLPAARRSSITMPMEAPGRNRIDDRPRSPVSESAAMRDVLALVDRAAESQATVLLTGETGTGKEVVARTLHEWSPRSAFPFIAVNCAAFPEALLESELFGHVRGAFTGADRAKAGLFQAAEGGTLFLDEIGEMGLDLQAKLLRVLQEREIRPVGATHTRRIDVRVVAATNQSLPEAVRQGRFRQDLYYRLDVFPIALPPLRQRRDDILPLARHFLARHGEREGKPNCHLSLAAGHLLQSHRWPGNVRELENEMLRAMTLVGPGELITPKVLSPRITDVLEPVGANAQPHETLVESLTRIEGWLIRRALANNGGKRARTARQLGLTREGLYKKMKRLGID